MMGDIQEYFFKYGQMGVLALYGYINSEVYLIEIHDFSEERNPAFFIQGILLLTLFFYNVIDLFSNIKFGRPLIYLNMVLLTALVTVSSFVFVQMIRRDSYSKVNAWAF